MESNPRRARWRRRLTVAATAIATAAFAFTTAVPAQALSGDASGAHDPSIIVQGTCYYAFSTGVGGTGGGTPQIRRSCGSNGRSGWTYLGTVFPSMPSWIRGALGATPSNIWAPDINYFNGRYYLHYSSAIWGRPGAVVGVATATNPAGPWTDQGEVSRDREPIDPNWAYAGSTPYIFTGGFAGVYVHRADGSNGRMTGNPTLISKRMENSSIVYNGGYYYLFGSKGKCCARADSDYYTVVARSTSITGPYVDKSGARMVDGAGSRILDSGGGDVFSDAGGLKFAYHYYNPQDNGYERLDIRPISFSGGWPVFGNPIG